jgi:hypothetical protein
MQQNKCWALAPAVCFSCNSLEKRPIFAASSVVPQMLDKKRRALVPAVCFSSDSLENGTFSAACLAVPLTEHDNRGL